MPPPLDSPRDKEPFRGRWKFVVNIVAKIEGTALGLPVTTSAAQGLQPAKCSLP